MTFNQMEGTELYRHFNMDGELLYVGISRCTLTRLAQHMSNSAWAREISRVEIDWHPTRAEALTAERRMIETHKPRGNVALNPDAAGKLRPFQHHVKDVATASSARVETVPFLGHDVHVDVPFWQSYVANQLHKNPSSRIPVEVASKYTGLPPELIREWSRVYHECSNYEGLPFFPRTATRFQMGYADHDDLLRNDLAVWALALTENHTGFGPLFVRTKNTPLGQNGTVWNEGADLFDWAFENGLHKDTPDE